MGRGGMDEVPLSRQEDCQLDKLFMSQYDGPAYIRRARRVEEALNQLVGRCQVQRLEWLSMVRLRVGLLHSLAGSWPALGRWLAAEQLGALERLHTELAPRLRHAVQPTSSSRTLRHAVRELKESIERFNQRWAE